MGVRGSVCVDSPSLSLNSTSGNLNLRPFINLNLRVKPGTGWKQEIERVFFGRYVVKGIRVLSYYLVE